MLGGNRCDAMWYQHKVAVQMNVGNFYFETMTSEALQVKAWSLRFLNSSYIQARVAEQEWLYTRGSVKLKQPRKI